MFIQLSEKSFIRTESILSVHATGSAQIKRVVEAAIAANRYVDTTRKKPTRSTIVTKENFVYDTTLLPETLVKRIMDAENNEPGRQQEDQKNTAPQQNYSQKNRKRPHNQR